MSEIVIRPLAMSDRDAFNAFFDGLAPDARMFFNRHDGNRNWGLRFFTGTETQDILRWVAVDGDEIVGYVFLWDTDTAVPYLGIGLAERMRGKRFGRTMIAHAANWAKEHGKGGILLTTHIANLRAQIMYEDCGFTRLGTDTTGQEFVYLLRF